MVLSLIPCYHVYSAALGRVIIKSNQAISSQFSKENTIYEVQDEINLSGKTITIPANCVLYFNGGSVANGTLKGNNTRLFIPFGQVFKSNLSLSGSFLSDDIKMSWWCTLGKSDNTTEVQAAFNSIASFINKVFTFDVPVRITDINYVLKYAPGVTFQGVNSSHQSVSQITVYGNNSQGIDISGSELLSFSNIVISGDKNSPPKCLLYSSKVKENNQSKGHTFYNISFRGSVSNCLVYNFAGEMWSFEKCHFSLSSENNANCFYGTILNTGGLSSKFGNTVSDANCLTVTSFTNCSISSRSTKPSVVFEGAPKKTVASIFFDRCYFYCPKGSSIEFKDVRGDVALTRCVDESGSQDSSPRETPFYSILGTTALSGFSLSSNTFYAKKNTAIVGASCEVKSYNSISNLVINSYAVWRFTRLTDAFHSSLSSTEKFYVTENAVNVDIKQSKKNINNIHLPSHSSRPSLTSGDEGTTFYDSELKKMILWNGRSWTNIDGSRLK